MPTQMNQPLEPKAAIVVGASAGGVEPLLQLFQGLPERFSIPIVVVVHLPEAGEPKLVEVFQDKVRMPVRQAQDKEPVEAGVLYFAGAAYHLSIEENRCFSLSDETPLHFARPSIDVLMQSAADAYGSELAGFILSGASRDGATGLASIKREGGLTVVQDPKEAKFPVMPQAAIDECEPDFVLTTDKMCELILKLDNR